MANTKKYVSLDKLGLYDEKIKKVITDSDAATLKSAKDYADGLATNYDAAGSAASALTEAKAYADGKDAAIAEAKKAGTDAAAAAKTADDKAVAAQGDVDALETYVGTIPSTATAKDIVGYVQEKTSGIATEGAMTELTARVDAVEDVAEANTEAIGDMSNTSYSTIADAITYLDGQRINDEGYIYELREEFNGAGQYEYVDELRTYGEYDEETTNLVSIANTLYQNKADKTEVKATTDGLQEQITTNANAIERLTNGVSADEIDGVNDLIAYVKEHGTEVTGMQEDIAENAEAIEGVAGRVGTLEGQMTSIQGAVATKAEKTYVDGKVEALQGVDAGFETRIAAIEGKFGGAEGSVEDMIADAKAEAIEAAAGDATTKANAAEANAKAHANGLNTAMDTRVQALETASATHALASDLTTLAGRVTTAEGEIDTLQTEMDAVEALAAANKAAHEANATAIALKASQADLEAVSGRVTTLETWHSNFVECSQEDINGLFD